MVPPRHGRYSEGIVGKTISNTSKWVVIATLYVGCTYHLSPVNCDTDWRRQNYTPFNQTYIQQRSWPPSPYQPNRPQYSTYSSQSYNSIRTRNPYYEGNEAEKYVENSLSYGYDDSPLLVAHSHDPYGNSVKSVDFVRRSADRRSERPVEKRGKRGVLHLYNMISCATDCDPVSYKGYGCFCGFLGSGTALDGIDRCCQNHDECYEDLFCPFFTVYFQPYYWRCRRGRPVCALENLDTRDEFIGGCAAALCECDRKLAMCLRKLSCPRGPALCTSSPLRFLQNLIMIR